MTSENIKSYAILVALGLSILLSSLSTSIANVALPNLAQNFHASMQEVQWVVLAYLLTITTLIVSVGRLGDLIGRRRLLLFGLMTFTIASVLCAIASDLWFLIAARALQGAAAATMMALAMAMVAGALPKERTGSAMGLLGSMSAVGTALGPVVGGFLIGGVGWQAIFAINIPFALLTWLLVYCYLPAESQSEKQPRLAFDFVGSLLLAFSLGTYALAMTLGRSSFQSTNAALLLMTLTGLAMFVRVQSRSTAPLIELSLFRQPELSGGFAMSALVTTVVMATLVVGPFYLAEAFNLDTAHIGLVMSSGPIVAAVTGLPAGRLVDRFGATIMCSVGLVVMFVGSASVVMLAGHFGLAAYIAPLVLMTAGYALFQAANNAAVMSSIDVGQRGLIAGMLNLARNLGLITGASLMGRIFAISSASHTLTPDTLGGLRITFAVATGLIILALFIQVRRT
ncbi:MFS transporter [Undibacterium sp. Ji22W]|uniref:MFS transporter n=1 Tax=Undibacterium sp. Ji22W TaxID=3413038 RepID=UPI003BF31F07